MYTMCLYQVHCRLICFGLEYLRISRFVRLLKETDSEPSARGQMRFLSFSDGATSVWRAGPGPGVKGQIIFNKRRVPQALC